MNQQLRAARIRQLLRSAPFRAVTLPDDADTEVCRQLKRSAYWTHIAGRECAEKYVTGTIHSSSLDRLDRDHRFIRGLLYALHDDVGDDLTEFRSIRGSFGKGSLQIVVDKHTFRCYADVDKWSPYDDVVGFLGHAFGDVLPGWFRRWR